MNRNWVRRGGAMTAVASFALVMLAACGSGAGQEEHEDVTRVPTMSDAAAQATRDAANAPATPEGEGGTPTTADAPAAADGETAAATVEVASYDIYFEPAELTIPANTDVTVVLPNNGAAPHNFSIDELGISVDLAPGATEETVINAPAGEYEYYCNVPGHKEAGMVGTLIVSEDAAAPAGAPGADGEATPAAQAGATLVAGTTDEAAAEATPEQEAVATPAQASPPAQAPAATPAEVAGATPAAGAAAAEAVEVVSLDIFFEPSELAIPADTDVTVTLPNDGVTLHNFSIDELGITVDIAPGATEETVINAPAGEYEYYCNVPGHKQAGMVGTLTVG